MRSRNADGENGGNDWGRGIVPCGSAADEQEATNEMESAAWTKVERCTRWVTATAWTRRRAIGATAVVGSLSGAMVAAAEAAA